MKNFAVFLMSVWDKTVAKLDCMKSKSIFSDSQWRLLGPGGSGFRHIIGVRSPQKRRANVVWSDAGPKRPSRKLGCVTEWRELEAERKGCYEPDQHSKRRTPESCRSVHSFERTGKIHFPICLHINLSVMQFCFVLLITYLSVIQLWLNQCIAQKYYYWEKTIITQ